jgi:uncharacterized protein affecting Mg2+/Co2+ transport
MSALTTQRELTVPTTTHTSSALTHDIRVEVSPRYHPERSRHWIITDATGREEHVRGPGVVGEQPRLLPGSTFQYTSFCPLPTSMGTMHGSFQMIWDDGVGFEAEIAPFTLVDPLDCN